ncbi:MAG TPA: DoxX family protein [Kofleriaceae bacterium]|nr:DoxX family protein [Kofleriaceae bacterium]
MSDPWSPARRVAFRFLVIYAVLYTLPGVLLVTPGFEWAGKLHDRVWEELLARVSDAFSLDVVLAEDNGSGDTSASYLTLVLELGLAAAGTALWTALDRARTSYPRTLDVLRSYLRLVLAYSMMWYGLAKVFKSQFPAPSPGRLMQPIGDASPMGLLWTFMGASTPYTIFAGLAELIGGLLLLWRRTTAAGALILAAVLSHVVLLNFCYDVPVKLYSSHLLLIALFLVWPHAQRLVDVLVRNRATQPVDLGTFPVPPRMRRPVAIAKWLVVAFLLAVATVESWSGYRTVGDGADHGPLYGDYDADGGEGGARWRRVGISRSGVSILTEEGEIVRHGMTYDEERAQLLLRRNGTELVYGVERVDADTIIIEGREASHRLVRRAPTLLESRGFHWVNEAPFNR